MERGKYRRLVREFPFVEEILCQIRISRSSQKDPLLICERPEIQIARVDENFLRAVLQRLYGEHIDAPAPGWNWYWERLWASDAEGTIKDVDVGYFGRGVPTDENQPLIGFLQGFERSSHFVISREELTCSEDYERQYSIKLTIYKPSRRIDLSGKVVAYVVERDRKEAKEREALEKRWATFLAEGTEVLYLGKPFCFPQWNYVFCKGVGRVDPIELFRRMHLDRGMLSQIFVERHSGKAWVGYYDLSFDQRPKQSTVASYKALADHVLPFGDVEAWTALAKLIGKTLKVAQGLDDPEILRIHHPDGRVVSPEGLPPRVIIARR